VRKRQKVHLPNALCCAKVNFPQIFILEIHMTVAKIIEISASSKKSFEDAINVGIARASDSVDDIQGAWVQEQKVVVAKGKVVEYRVQMKLTFVLQSKTSKKK
jgi:dodecin